ncbi:MAG: F0F1 ATP synthase subunit A [Anaerolineae bacterium]|nr:F0F1 ATP synthase subunit A [Anaerolineae bacterium]
MEETKKTGWRWGVNRWFILLFMVCSYFAAKAFAPIRPHVQLPAEPLSHNPLFTLPVIGEFYLTNTIVALLLADLILILIALAFKRASSSGNLVITGVSGVIEALLEVIYNLTETTAGKRARQIFPWFATITMLVLVINWMELIPGVDSIGILEHSDHGYATQEFFGGSVATIVGEELEHGGEVLVPFVRVTSTDLNFTVALALIAVIGTQVMGVKALGGHYFSKFWNTKTMFTVPMFGVIDFAVGILEVVSEISKVLSFSFRLFGNIFAGSVLLFVIGSLVPVFAQSGFLMLEFFVGMIQAIVFGLLTMTFMAQATISHGGDEHEGAHA